MQVPAPFHHFLLLQKLNHINQQLIIEGEYVKIDVNYACFFSFHLFIMEWNWEKHLQQWQMQLIQLVPLDLCGHSRSRESWHSTTVVGKKTQEGNWRTDKDTKWRLGNSKQDVSKDRRSLKCLYTTKFHNTHENHPMPQPKHGRGLSYSPTWESSTSLRSVYLLLMWSETSFPWPRCIINHFEHKWIYKEKTLAINTSKTSPIENKKKNQHLQ